MDYILIPLLSAFLAWFIAWFFVKAIFMNWNKGLTQQIEAFDIEHKLSSETTKAQFESVLPFIDEQLDQFFKHKLSEKMPIVSMFIGDKTVNQLKTVFIEELQILFPELVKKFATSAKEDFAHNLQKKWKPILEPALLKATRKYRLLAIFIGLIWGVLILLLTNHF